jgi:hypothetical protein
MVLSILLVLPEFAFAHHGNSEYAIDQTINFKAKLTRIDLINPHSWLYFDVTEKDGRISHHRCEMRSVHQLRRLGWTSDLFPVGQQITIEASPNKTDYPNSCYLQTMLFADGARMDRYGQYAKAPKSELADVRASTAGKNTIRPALRPTGEPNISGEWAPALSVAAPGGDGGRFAFASQPGNSSDARRGAAAPGSRLYGGSELTDLGTQGAADFKREDDPRFRCESTSIVFDWVAVDVPVNRITQNKETIVIEYGWLGLKRTIYMNMKEHPQAIKPSRAGHSIGRWEGNKLVVDTVGFLPGYLRTPVRNSEKLHE